MNINRHNYEYHFILYLDNELSQAERKAVEDFLLINPDLQQEMDSLKLTILSPDEDLVFKDKDALLMSESTINDNNCEGFLVQYIDGELAPEQSAALEKYLVQNPAAQLELELLINTKAVPDNNITFGDKSALYRYEKVHRVYSMRWLKQAVAAAMILAASTGIFMLADNDKNADPVVAVTESTKTVPSQIPNQSANPVVKTNERPDQSGSAANQKQVMKEVIEKRQPAVQFASIPSSKNKDQENLTHKDVLNNQNDLEKPLDIPVRLKNISTADEKLYANLQQQNINEQGVTNKLPVRTTTEASPEIVQPLYVVDVADVEQDNKKIRGFFRKATRIFERTTNIAAANEDDKILVGGFAINLK